MSSSTVIWSCLSGLELPSIRAHTADNAFCSYRSPVTASSSSPSTLPSLLSAVSCYSAGFRTFQALQVYYREAANLLAVSP